MVGWRGLLGALFFLIANFFIDLEHILKVKCVWFCLLLSGKSCWFFLYVFQTFFDSWERFLCVHDPNIGIVTTTKRTVWYLFFEERQQQKNVQVYLCSMFGLLWIVKRMLFLL
mmetsp:Transcript_39986/g.60493  ORF Transcript_39986/g.60493 Transcript_39986/m.60493 type:complete len:113 (-) Transcript_39986:2708-3046(-)